MSTDALVTEMTSLRWRTLLSKIALGGMAGALLSTLLGCSAEDDNKKSESGGGFDRRAIPVVASPVEMTTLNETVQAVGTARALESVVLYPETAGLVTQVNFTADQRVNKGDVLLQLESRDEQLAVDLAEVNLEDAKRLLKRYTSVNRATTNIAQSEIDTAEAAVKSAAIALEQAQIALDRRAIKAPFDGRVGLSDINVGDRIDTSMVITTLDNRSELLISFAVPEAFVGQVTPGTPITVELWESAEQSFSGEVVAVDSRIDQLSRAFMTRAKIDNRSDRYRPGMAFEIRVNVSRGAYLSVPDVAVQWGADGAYVWIEQDGVAARKDVTLVKRLPNRLLLKGDITPGTQVIAEGVQSVREGVALRLLDAADLDRNARRELDKTSDTSEQGPSGGQ